MSLAYIEEKKCQAVYRWYNYASKDNKRGNSGDRMDASSCDKSLPVFYKRDVMVACMEPSEPLTWCSKIVYANLYRVSYSRERLRFWPRERAKRGEEREEKYEYVFYTAALNDLRVDNVRLLSSGSTVAAGRQAFTPLLRPFLRPFRRKFALT